MTTWLIRRTNRRALVYGGMLVVVAGVLASVALFAERLLALVTAMSLLPLLLMVALLVQSIAESRLLVEYGMFLLVVIAVKTRRAKF